MKIRIKVYPNSKKEEIKQTGYNSFKVKIKAKPEKGKANQAVINLLADFFELKKGDISLVQGLKSKNKIIEIKEEIDQIKIAKKVLQKGGIIAYPTDTVYGVGCNIFDKKAVKKIFKLKDRKLNEPFSVAVSDFKMLETIACPKEMGLIRKLLPGSVTVILQKKDNVTDLVTAGLNKVGIRIPENEIAVSIIKEAGFPIISTSANKSGKGSALRIEDIDLEVDFMVKGKCRYKRASTIVDLTNKIIKREGAGYKKVKNLINF
jgi:L-threonylcarbamoyladenylate synthase